MQVMAPSNSMLSEVKTVYSNMVSETQKANIESVIMQARKIRNNRLKKISIGIAPGDSIQYGLYDLKGSILFMMSANLDGSVLRHHVSHEVQHHKWAGRSKKQLNDWKIGVDRLLKKLGWAPSRYVQIYVDAKTDYRQADKIVYVNKDGKKQTYGDYLKSNPDIIYDESHSDVGAYIAEKDGAIARNKWMWKAVIVKVDGKSVMDHYADLYLKIFNRY